MRSLGGRVLWRGRSGWGRVDEGEGVGGEQERDVEDVVEGEGDERDDGDDEEKQDESEQEDSGRNVRKRSLFKRILRPFP